MTADGPPSAVKAWVEECAALLRPDKTVWCDGSDEERRRLVTESLLRRELIPLNDQKHPNSYLHRSAPNDTARTEKKTYICCPSRDDAGPTNNWMLPSDAKRKLSGVSENAMKGRTMYVIPFLMGAPGSPFRRVGVQVTDSRYVVLSMGVMTRMGVSVWGELQDPADFVRCIHATADLKDEQKFICHFPEEKLIWSTGSGYGGNALLGKKCLALRIASSLGRKEGWLAEHMLIMGVETPQGETRYVAAAFPSGCGKTNMAMMTPPVSMAGYKTWILGDDIAWLRVGADGRLWAVNPEAGFFGVAPGTSRRTNPRAMDALSRDTIFTNTALRPDGTVWWEGHDDPPPQEAEDWQGLPWSPDRGTPAAHPNSRFTTPLTRCAGVSPKRADPQGVPLDAIFFGGRRAALEPLVYETFDWSHGVFIGACTASETTAATQDQAVGVVRRDPMAMLPFCGYHMGDYLAHWLAIGRKLSRPPKIFRVNWFRRDADGALMWPGYGENLRVLVWALDRSRARAMAQTTALGNVPTLDTFPLRGLDLSRDRLKALLSVDAPAWREEVKALREYFARFGDKLPAAVRREMDALSARLGA